MCSSEGSSPGFGHTETRSCWLAASLSLVLEKWYWLSSFKAVTTFVFLHLSCFCRTLSCFDRDIDWACSSILTYRFDPVRRNKTFWCCGATVRLGTIFSLEGSIFQLLGRRKNLWNSTNWTCAKVGEGLRPWFSDCDPFSHCYPPARCSVWLGEGWEKLGKRKNLRGKENLLGLQRPDMFLFPSQWTKCQIKSIATANSRRRKVG